jgi:hypothetical protein
MASDTERTIEKTIRDRLPSGAVESVRIQEQFDNDGEPIFRITVVLKNPRSINRREMISLARHIQGAMTENRFPLLEFLSVSDARKREAA